ncbi:MAG: phytoene/squalene synthase family protein [Pseudoxanthomonas sp.]
MTDTTALDNFTEKWRSRWPEWQVAETFVPAAQREAALAWFALLQEFEDIMNIAGDPLPADAKLAWWGEELRDWSRRRSRHPLGRVLEPHAAPWFQLGEKLPLLQQLRKAQGDEALALATELAQTLAVVEQVILGGAQPDVLSLRAALLASRPVGAESVASDRDIPAQSQGSTPRRLLMALHRLRAESTGKAPSFWRILWRCWRAARG